MEVEMSAPFKTTGLMDFPIKSGDLLSDLNDTELTDMPRLITDLKEGDADKSLREILQFIIDAIPDKDTSLKVDELTQDLLKMLEAAAISDQKRFAASQRTIISEDSQRKIIKEIEVILSVVTQDAKTIGDPDLQIVTFKYVESTLIQLKNTKQFLNSKLDSQAMAEALFICGIAAVVCVAVVAATHGVPLAFVAVIGLLAVTSYFVDKLRTRFAKDKHTFTNLDTSKYSKAEPKYGSTELTPAHVAAMVNDIGQRMSNLYNVLKNSLNVSSKPTSPRRSKM